MASLKPYHQSLPYSYAIGLYPCITLLEKKPESVKRLLLSDKAQGDGVEKLRALCVSHGVREEIAPKLLNRISGKDNCFAALVFDKWDSQLESTKPHVVLHHPMDEGNLGTILRTLLGFGIFDVAIIKPAVDPFDPKVVRATMGAIFSMRYTCYDSFEEYNREYKEHSLYPFMLDGSKTIEEVSIQTPYTLVFGNESKGLPSSFATIGQPVRIEHSNMIDSLNLSVAVAIGSYMFTKGGR